MEREVILERKDADDWIYRGEGAANIVLAYTGSNPAFVGKVLRMQKVPRNRSQCLSDTPVLSIHECLLWKDIGSIVSSPQKENAKQLYVQHVMSPLLGSDHVDPGLHIHVSKDFLESVDKNVHSWRPAWRVGTAKINISCYSALLISDHSIFPDSLEEKPCISVEIKPKCGFIPNSRFITEGNSVKRSISRFRMHQFLKLHQNEVSQVSEYDPLDLFSGCKDRIHKAIKALFAHPQNNLRVFLNGSLVFGSLAGSTGSTIFVNGEAFENALKHAIWAEDGLRTMSFVHLVAETVFKSRVLDLLLKVQHRDNLDIEGAIHAYYDVVSQPCIVCRDLGEDQTSGKYAILHSIPLDESFNIVRDYLIAATAKDCSLIISFRPRENGKQGSPYCDVHLESTNQNFDYKVCTFVKCTFTYLRHSGRSAMIQTERKRYKV
ncbi:inositol-pentakisphosphate 2-kinase-like isoform X2 [Malania oleifera]|uniref:inositol-pentakisphosphate 2-kinase-like isoform X2 n=1 Tax=Malania oleifera TaxID=397392 RepID=UPI0025ADC059|nr:inositol-pentakisphosphate 2-kinase-like isoform X2 [Malania oleifera]